MSDFQTVFKNSATVKLLQILDAPGDYSAEAVEAAKVELAGRDDVEEALIILNKRKAEGVAQMAKTAKMESVIMEKLGSLFSIINPFHSENVTGERRLKLLLILFGGLSIYGILQEFPYVLYGFRYEKEDLDFILSYYLLPMLILPVGTFLLFKRKKIGWGILYAWSVGNCLSALGGAYYMWDYESVHIPLMDGLIPQTSTIQIILGAIVIGTIIVALVNKEVRNLAYVDKRTVMIWTIIGLMIPFVGSFF